MVVLACLAAAGPAAAQAPDPDATVNATVTCDGEIASFVVLASGLNPGESYGVMVVDDGNVGQLAATASDVTSSTGAFEARFGADVGSGTYTVYAYTGPYQTFDPAGWPGSIGVETFDPSLTTSWTSTTVEVTCGPPTREQCKAGGFEAEGYRNQGQCVSASAPGRQ